MTKAPENWHSQTKDCSESQSVRLVVKCTPYVYPPDGREQALKTHTHTHPPTHHIEEDQVERFHLKGTGREMQVPSRRAFVSLRSEFCKDVLSSCLSLTSLRTQ